MNNIIGVWINYRKAVIVDNEDIRLVLWIASEINYNDCG